MREGTAELTAALDPGNWPIALRLGTALGSMGAERQGEAMDCLRRVIALSPGNAVAHLQLGLAFWRRGAAAPAIALAERAAGKAQAARNSRKQWTARLGCLRIGRNEAGPGQVMPAPPRRGRHRVLLSR
jgi:thioredoxin-like negative regulator of GroEL